ncbi:sodium/calcium exchanger protein [Ditylenchus destructor]|nr:sodium/calcium exchanger protein [Ditylenchus destructor]
MGSQHIVNARRVGLDDLSHVNTSNDQQRIMLEDKCASVKPCSPGLILPMWGNQNDELPVRIFRAFLYLSLMIYLFLGVSIVADRFMSAIDVITSQQRNVTIKGLNGETKVVSVRMWNETVSNLTLMALGSSAPEILLTVIEVIGNKFEAGDLGPGTIIGSAAFNFFCIIGLCIIVVPGDEKRRIERNDVFWVTVIWSTFAYIWLYLILCVFSPNIVQVWEALLTLIFFALTVTTAYWASRYAPNLRRLMLNITRPELRKASAISHSLTEPNAYYAEKEIEHMFPKLSIDGYLYQRKHSGIHKLGTDVGSADHSAVEYVEIPQEENSNVKKSTTYTFVDYVSLPWEMLFSCIPSTKYCHGWACFIASIVSIGILTAIIGDTASLFGCTIGLKDTVTAITIVALGTSIPDTFASKLAAIQNPTADSSIGNVTGSNAVNVFLGIGIAWSIAAIYHAWNGNAFHVHAGSLAASVALFTIGSTICVVILQLRRHNKMINAELGGPAGCKWLSAGIFFLIWILYITYCALDAYCLF